jgi:septum formation protein
MNSIPPFILASSSPRRKELLQDAGFNFTVSSINTDESYKAELKPIEVVEFVARKKLLAASNLLGKILVLAADTLVFKGNEILGKPATSQEAAEMLNKLSGVSHEVTTSVCLGYKKNIYQFSVTTNVFFNELKKSEIDYYIEKYSPLDKAGAYGIQEWIGKVGISKIEGSYTNVVGLPMPETYNAIIECSRKWLK